MKTKELKELKEAAEKLIYLRNKKDSDESTCAICNAFIDEFQRDLKKDLCYLCLSKWFKIATPEIVVQLAIKQIQSNFARDEQIELGGERICRD